MLLLTLKMLKTFRESQEAAWLPAPEDLDCSVEHFANNHNQTSIQKQTVDCHSQLTWL